MYTLTVRPKLETITASDIQTANRPRSDSFLPIPAIILCNKYSVAIRRKPSGSGSLPKGISAGKLGALGRMIAG